MCEAETDQSGSWDDLEARGPEGGDVEDEAVDVEEVDRRQYGIYQALPVEEGDPDWESGEATSVEEYLKRVRQAPAPGAWRAARQRSRTPPRRGGPLRKRAPGRPAARAPLPPSPAQAPWPPPAGTRPGSCPR